MDEIGRRRLLLILYLGFISLGLPDTVLGVAWPAMRLDFAAPLAGAGWLLTLGTVVSAGSSLAVGRLGERLRGGLILAVSTLMTSAALLGYGLAPGLAAAAAATLLFGVGQGAVDAAVNAYMAKNYSARHMNWVHGCWGLGATGGPLVFTAVFSLGLSWRGGYLALAAVQALFAAVFLRTLSLWRNPESPAPEPGGGLKPDGNWNPIRACAGVAFYFFYAGLETVAGLWAASYMVEELGAAPSRAGAALTLYWAALTLGRFVVGFLAGPCGNRSLVRGGLGLSALGLTVAVLIPGTAAFAAALPILGLGLAPLYPTMMHETSRRTGAERADRIIGCQVGAALAGAAVLPALAGFLVQRVLSLGALPWLLMVIAVVLAAVHEVSAGFLVRAARGRC